MPIIRPVVEQYAENASALWQIREIALGAPHYSLADIVVLEDRIEAQLEGLRIAGEPGWEICKAALKQGDESEIFAAGVLALESKDWSKLSTILGVLSSAPERVAGLISAFGWLPVEPISPALDRMLGSTDPVGLTVGIGASGLHRQDPGPVLKEALRSPDSALRATAYRAAGEVGRVDLVSSFWFGYEDESAEVRYWAARSGALLGEPNSIDFLKKIACAGSRRSDEATSWAFRRMDRKEAAQSWQDFARAPERARQAAVGAGVIGDPAMIPWLIEKMQIPELARVTGESFAMITGADLAFEDLDGEKPKGYEPGPTPDPDEPEVALDPDESLSWPDPNCVAAWWSARKAELKAGTRYLLARPMTPENLQWVLRNGRQRQRAAAASEQALAQPGRRLFEMRVPAVRQRAMLEGKIGVAGGPIASGAR